MASSMSTLGMLNGAFRAWSKSCTPIRHMKALRLHLRYVHWLGVALLTPCCSNDEEPPDSIGRATNAIVAPALYGATFGANDFGGLGACAGLPNIDGLPVVFSSQLDAATVLPQNFSVQNAVAGAPSITPTCATLAPANDADENRTVLLQGSFGTPNVDEPTTVTVTGPVRGVDGLSFQNLSVPVVSFDTGQYLVHAQTQSLSGNVGGRGQCPATGVDGTTTVQIVQLTFGSNAGASFPSTAEYRRRFHVTLADGSAVIPNAFGDTGADNYLELCVGSAAIATSVRIDTNTVRDAAGQFNASPTSAPIEAY